MMTHLRALAALAAVMAYFGTCIVWPPLFGWTIGALIVVMIYGMAYGAMNPGESDTHGV